MVLKEGSKILSNLFVRRWCVTILIDGRNYSERWKELLRTYMLLYIELISCCIHAFI